MTLRTLQHQVARVLAGQTGPDEGGHAGLTLAAELLVAKRRVEAGSWLPRTARALGPTFARRFADHARRHRPRGWNPPRDDAAAFAALIASDRDLPRAIRDVAAYEQALALGAAPGPLFLVRHLHADPTRPDGRAGIHLWWRWHRRARLRHLALPWG